MAPDPVAGQAAGYLISRQLPDGGFDVASRPGVETTQAILALAASSQQSAAWNTYAARSDLELVRSYGRNPLDLIDGVVNTPVADDVEGTAATAARVLALVANPLGLPATAFDPADPVTGPVDLLARIDAARQRDGSYAMGGDFGAVLYAAIGLARARPPVPRSLVDQILAAQNADGSWDAGGVSKASGDDVATTALALVALKGVGRDLNNIPVLRGVGYLARSQQRTGAWQAFGTDDPEATSAAAVALSALHIDVTVGSWVVPFAVGASPGYRSPYAWLATRQETSTGRIVSPRDDHGITTLPTSAAVQALARQYYLRREHAAFAAKLSRTIGTPDAVQGTDAAEIVSGAVGPNVAIGSARLRAATTLLSSMRGREAAASDLFRQAFGRTIDRSGLSYWSNALARISRPEMLSRLTGSAEFYRLAGGNAPLFVDAAYQAVLGRPPDASGRRHWITRLGTGVPVESIARTLVASTEYRRIQVTAAYIELLGRAPDDAGSAYWVKKLASTRIEVLLAGIASSRELLDDL